jgi:hypothetical protein
LRRGIEEDQERLQKKEWAEKERRERGRGQD